jgi:hypothetical protein
VEVLDKANLRGPIAGRVLGRGLANELTGTPYLVVSGTDGKMLYAALSTHSERHLALGARAGDIVMLSGVESGAKGYVDRNIVELSNRHGGIYDAQQHIESIRDRRLPHEATPERYVEAHTLRLDALVSRGLVTRESEGCYRVPPDLIERLQTDPAPARDATFIKVDVRGRDLGTQAVASAFTWLDEQLVAGVVQHVRQVAVRTRFQNELIEAAEQRARRLVQLGFARIEGDGVRIDPQLKSKLTRLERDTAAERLSQQHGRFVDLDESRRFTGRVATIDALASGPHAVVVNEGRFTLVPADRGLSKLVGKDVSLSLASSPGRDAEQARVRFRVLDAMDLSPSLGPSLGR